MNKSLKLSNKVVIFMFLCIFFVGGIRGLILLVNKVFFFSLSICLFVMLIFFFENGAIS